MIKENNFKSDLEWSHARQDDEIFDEYYRNKFDGVLSIEKVDCLKLQKLGIDKVINQTFDRRITIDEKKRRESYTDVLIELFSVSKLPTDPPKNPSLGSLLSRDGKRRGWAFKNNCDFIVYAIMPMQTLYLIPQKLLTIATRKHWKSWCQKYHHKCASNFTYWTVSVPVPTQHLFECLQNEMTDTFTYQPEAKAF
jgi:hypothetical protein